MSSWPWHGQPCCLPCSRPSRSGGTGAPDRRPGRHRRDGTFDPASFEAAAALFAEVALPDDYADFHTVPAYERMPCTRRPRSRRPARPAFHDPGDFSVVATGRIQLVVATVL